MCQAAYHDNIGSYYYYLIKPSYSVIAFLADARWLPLCFIPLVYDEKGKETQTSSPFQIVSGVLDGDKKCYER